MPTNEQHADDSERERDETRPITIEMTFARWKAVVDKFLIKKCGITSECLPDVDYVGMWDSCQSPEEAADYVIEYAKG